MTTFFNKRILGNRKKHGVQAGGAAALIAAVAGYRGLEEEGLPISFGKLATFSLGFGAIAGLIWASTPAAKKLFTAQDKATVNRSVKPVVIIGVASTIRDFEDDRMELNKAKDDRGSKYSYPWSNSSTSYRKSGGLSWERTRPSYASAISADDDDGDILSDSTLRSIAHRDDVDDDLSLLMRDD